jgi:hypothetical protein
MIATLRYTTSGLQVAPSAGQTAKWNISCNGLFDPDITYTGHQPLYFDTFSAVYNHYTVINSVLTARCYNATAAIQQAGVMIEDDITSSTTIDTLKEASTSQWTTLALNSNSRSVKTFKYPYSARRVLGYDPYTSLASRTPYTQNPSEQSFFLLWNVDTASGVSSVYWDIEVVYTAFFTELRTPTQS